MRRHFLDRLTIDLEAAAETQTRELMLQQYGPRCSGWLINQHRHLFHKAGSVDMDLPSTLSENQREKLYWFFLAIEFLRKRKGWAVDVLSTAVMKTYRVRWLGWPPRARVRQISAPGNDVHAAGLS